MSDADCVQRYAADVRLHATCNLPSPYPEGGAASFIDLTLKANDAGKQFTFAVLNSGEFVGLIGLNDVHLEERTAELDYWIGFPFWNRGIATCAASLAIGYAFQSIGLQTLFSSALIRNPASLRVLEKNGFIKVGEHFYNGLWKDRFRGEMLARHRILKFEHPPNQRIECSGPCRSPHERASRRLSDDETPWHHRQRPRRLRAVDREAR
ncbi:GNAT family N-acetyltransferase [Horticoccus luteus]